MTSGTITIWPPANCRELAIVGGAEAAIGHLHDAGVGIGGGGARLLLLLDLLLVGLAAPFAFSLDFSQLFQRCRHALLAFTQGPFVGRSDPPAAGLRIVGCFVLQLSDQSLRLAQLLVKLLAAPERLGPSRCAHPYSVLRHLIEVDDLGYRQAGDVFAQQPIQKLRVRRAEVGKAVIVHTHSAAEPPIDVVALTQPCQRPRTANALARRIKPKCQ